MIGEKLMLSDAKPFNLISNIYYVGSRKYCCHIIDTGEGLIMIDNGYEENADMIVDSMNILGLDIKDVKIIIHSHGHADHTAASPKLVELSGAKTYMHKADMRYLLPGQTIDVFVKDGDVISLGNTNITCMETPGHTLGTLSFFFDVVYNNKTYRAGMFGGAGTNQLKKNYLLTRHGGNLSYLQRAMFFESIEKIKKEHVDIFIGNHPWNNDTFGKAERIATSEINPFIDPDNWCKFLDTVKTDLENIIEEESRSLFVNFAHRGASEYAPENTILAFNLGIYMGANGIETDVQLTKDGVAVLFHDDTLQRVTAQQGCISDYTFDELQEFFVTKNEFSDKIVKLDDFMRFFHFRDMTFAIELKQRGTAKIAADTVSKYNINHKIVFTSFNFDELCDLREYAPNFKTGYLTNNITDELLAKMRELGIDEICPEAHMCNKEIVNKWHKMGFNVRAWGVYDENLMKQAYDAGCDGMTVNFPDKLTSYIKSKA